MVFRKNELSSVIVHRTLEKWTFMFLPSQMQNNQEKKNLEDGSYTQRTWLQRAPCNQPRLTQYLGSNCSTAPWLSLLIPIISELCPVTSVTSVFWPHDFVFTFLLLSIRSKYLKRKLSRYGRHWCSILLLCLPRTIQKKNLATFNFLAAQKSMNRYFSVNRRDSCLLFSMTHHGSSWEGFIFLSHPREGKPGEQDRSLNMESPLL